MNHWLGHGSASPSLFEALGAEPYDGIVLRNRPTRCDDEDDDDLSFSTALELVPHCAAFQGDESSDAKEFDRSAAESDEFMLCLHPALEEVLILSSILCRSKAHPQRFTSVKNASDDKCCESRKESHSVSVTICFVGDSDEIHMVDGNDALSSAASCSSTFWAERTGVQDEDVASIAVRFVCCSCTLYECDICALSRLGSAHEPTDVEDDLSFIVQLLKQGLEERIVTSGGIIGIELPPPRSSRDLLNDDSNGNPVVAFFMVEGIRILQQSQDDAPKQTLNFGLDGNGDADDDACPLKGPYRLGSSDSFEISFLPSHTNAAVTLSDADPENCNVETKKTLGSFGFRDRCSPGYESLLDELMALAAVDTRSGAPSATLLSGVAGVGKTRMASCLVNRLSEASDKHKIIARIVSAQDVLLTASSSISDRSSIATNILANFPVVRNSTLNHAKSFRAVLVFDDLDALVNSDEDCGSDSSDQDTEQRTATNVIVEVIDQLNNRGGDGSPFILGLCSASPSRLPSSVVRVGGFEKIVTMHPPSQIQREAMLRWLLDGLPTGLFQREAERSVIQIDRWAAALAPNTAGCVAADLHMICMDALTRASSRMGGFGCREIRQDIYSFPMPSDLCVTWTDISEAARACIPSQLAYLDVTLARSADDNDVLEQVDYKKIHDRSWKFFGGYSDVKKRIYRTVVRPWRQLMSNYLPEKSLLIPSAKSTNNVGQQAMSRLDILPPSGVLFHGPPGVGKSIAAQNLASSLGMHVVKVRASDVLDQWLGGSEAAIRSIFTRARAAAPCILFFDEIDSLATNREDDDGASSNVHSRILSTLLNEIDGISNGSERQGVLVVAATNRLSAIDAALLRPGRLEEHIHLQLPTKTDVEEILKIYCAKIPLGKDMKLGNLAGMMCELGMSGADVEGVCCEACLISMRCVTEEHSLDGVKVQMDAFEDAIHCWKT